VFVTNDEIVKSLIRYFEHTHSILIKNDFISLENTLLEKESQTEGVEISKMVVDLKDLELFDFNQGMN